MGRKGRPSCGQKRGYIVYVGQLHSSLLTVWEQQQMPVWLLMQLGAPKDTDTAAEAVLMLWAKESIVYNSYKYAGELGSIVRRKGP